MGNVTKNLIFNSEITLNYNELIKDVAKFNDFGIRYNNLQEQTIFFYECPKINKVYAVCYELEKIYEISKHKEFNSFEDVHFYILEGIYTIYFKKDSLVCETHIEEESDL